MVYLGFNEFNWFSLGFTGIYWVLLGFTGCYLVVLGFTGFQWILLGFIGCYWVLLGLNLVLLGFTGFHFARISVFTGFYRVYFALIGHQSVCSIHFFFEFFYWTFLHQKKRFHFIIFGTIRK